MSFVVSYSCPICLKIGVVAAKATVPGSLNRGVFQPVVMYLDFNERNILIFQVPSVPKSMSWVMHWVIILVNVRGPRTQALQRLTCCLPQRGNLQH